jgi:hypothetical protein
MKSLRRVAVLQWLGLFVAPLAWFAQHMIGQAVSQASCDRVNEAWGISNDAWQIVLLAVAGSLILLSEAAAVAAFLGTRDGSYEEPPPLGRMQLIAIAAMTTNLLYLVIILLDGVASIVNVGCAQG